MWSWLVSKIIQPFLPYILGGMVVLSIGAYFKGRADMDAKWQARNMQATIDAQAQTIARYRTLAEETQKQAEQEIQDAEESKRLIEERMKQAVEENAAMEAQLAATITDKDKLNEALKSLRTKCAANARDVDLDKRLREQQGNSGRVSRPVVPKPRRSGTP